jgi:phage N-6-adenine-methyltransferase
LDLSTQAVMFSGATDKWSTPRALAAEKVELYRLDLDVCADPFNAVVPRFFTEAENGLRQDWNGARVWCNPPYGESEKPCKAKCTKQKCVKRGWHRASYWAGCPDFVAACRTHGQRGGLSVMLLPARTETRWWHKHIWNRETRSPYPGVSVDFLPGRLKFGSAKSGAPFPSVLVVFGDP